MGTPSGMSVRAEPWRLRSQPREPPSGPLGPGLLRLGLDPARDAVIHVPPAAAGGEPRPLAVMLHGAGSDAGRGLAPLLGQADERGIVLLAPESRAASRNVIRGGFGPDAAFPDSALDRLFGMCPVDPGRVALGGFTSFRRRPPAVQPSGSSTTPRSSGPACP